MSANIPFRLRTASLILAAGLALAACDSSEDRAEEHYQSAVELAEAGDDDRAIIELRNALQLNENHIGARRLFAEIALERGEFQRGYGQLLAIVEYDPDDLVARQQLAEVAIRTQNWDEAERHGTVLLEASAEGGAPEGTDVVDLALRFRRAVLDENEPLVRELTLEAEALYEAKPGNEVLQRLLVDGYMRNGQDDEALRVIEAAKAIRPDDRALYEMRAAIFNQREDIDGVIAELTDMLVAFPDDDEVRGNLIRSYLAAGRADEAEAFMRGLVDETEGGLSALVSLIAYVRQAEGIDAALAELDAAIAEREAPEGQLMALRAGLLFDRGDQDAAIAEMEKVLEGAEDDINRLNWKVALARMLLGMGNEVGARTQIEEVLSEDPNNTEAVKMSAAWQIEADETQDAIASLRGALDQAPNDPQLLMLLSQAHARAGESELSEEMLALSVEASNFAPQPSILYARQLVASESYRGAEDVLIASLRRNGNRVELLELLGQVYLREEDFLRAQQVEATLRRLDTPQATLVADDLKVRVLGQQQGRDAAVQYLEGLVGASDDDMAARVALIRARLASGEREQALRLARDFAADAGEDNEQGQLVLAAALLASGELTEAEGIFEAVVESNPQNLRAWTQAVRVETAQGKIDEALQTIQTGLAANPGAADLLWAEASIAEAQNRIDDAIGIYETLYERLSNSVVVANNLASLLATYRDDDESLERAFTVARRLRGTDVPPFQDTYGWILYRRGEVEEAVTYLEPAAAGLPNDPIVQYHLGRALRDLGREDEALAAFERAVDLVPEDDPRQQIADARAAIEALSAGE